METAYRKTLHQEIFEFIPQVPHSATKILNISYKKAISANIATWTSNTTILNISMHSSCLGKKNHRYREQPAIKTQSREISADIH